MKKKVKFRIVHYYQKCYVIKYCTYYFIPLIWELLESSAVKHYKSIPELFSKDQAEYFCKAYGNINIIKDYNNESFLDKYCEFKLINP